MHWEEFGLIQCCTWRFMQALTANIPNGHKWNLHWPFRQCYSDEKILNPITVQFMTTWKLIKLILDLIQYRPSLRYIIWKSTEMKIEVSLMSMLLWAMKNKGKYHHHCAALHLNCTSLLRRWRKRRESEQWYWKSDNAPQRTCTADGRKNILLSSPSLRANKKQKAHNFKPHDQVNLLLVSSKVGRATLMEG